MDLPLRQAASRIDDEGNVKPQSPEGRTAVTCVSVATEAAAARRECRQVRQDTLRNRFMGRIRLVYTPNNQYLFAMYVSTGHEAHTLCYDINEWE